MTVKDFLDTNDFTKDQLLDIFSFLSYPHSHLSFFFTNPLISSTLLISSQPSLYPLTLLHNSFSHSSHFFPSLTLFPSPTLIFFPYGLSLLLCWFFVVGCVFRQRS